MKETAIRRTSLSDLPYCYEICLLTGDAGKSAASFYKDPYLLGQYYAAPYLVYPEGVCFVVEHECRPQGYIVAAPDTSAYNRWLETEWLPPLRELFPQPAPQEQIRSANEERIVGNIHRRHFPSEIENKPWYKDYPAHLHIDLLPGIQGKGWGRSLVKSLCAALAERGAKGVHLGVAKRNAGAVAFYAKMGFSVLEESDTGFTLGKFCRD